MADTQETKQVTLDPSKMSIHADESLLVGRYSNLINATVSSHDCTLDFIFVDATTAASKNPSGFLQARIVLSYSNIEPLINLLQRQLDVVKSGPQVAE